jgi:hypothetical protein
LRAAGLRGTREVFALAGALLASCGDAAAPEPAAVAGPVPACETLLVVAVDGLRLDDPWLDAEVAPHLANLAARGARADAAVGSAAGLHAGLAALLTGLEPWESGAASVHDPAGFGLPDAAVTWPEELGSRGWRASALLPLPHLRGELSGLHQGFSPFVAPALEPGALLDARQLEALVAAEWGPLLAADGPLALVLGLADLSQETEPDPADAVPRVRAALAPHLQRLPHVAAALEGPPSEALAEVARLLGRARGAEAYLAWRRGLREARLAAVDRAVGRALRAVDEAGRADGLGVVLVSLRGTPVAPPAAGPRAAFLPELTRVPLVVTAPGATGPARLAGVWTPARAAGLVQALAAGGALPEAPSTALVGDGLGERFAAFGAEHHLEERARVQRAAWTRDGQPVPLGGEDGPAELLALGSTLDGRPVWGWRLELAAGGAPVGVRWRALEGYLHGDAVAGARLEEASLAGVTASARLAPSEEASAWAELRQGRRTQELLLTLEGALPVQGPWSQGALLLDAGGADPAPDEPSPDPPEPLARVRTDSGWARVQLQVEGTFRAHLERHPAAGDEPPLDWSVDARLETRRSGPDGLLVEGADPALLALALPPRTELALAIRRGAEWQPPWALTGPDGCWGSRERARLILTARTLEPPTALAEQGSEQQALVVTPLRPLPAHGAPRAVPAHLVPFLRRLPPSE